MSLLQQCARLAHRSSQDNLKISETERYCEESHTEVKKSSKSKGVPTQIGPETKKVNLRQHLQAQRRTRELVLEETIYRFNVINRGRNDTVAKEAIWLRLLLTEQGLPDPNKQDAQIKITESNSYAKDIPRGGELSMELKRDKSRLNFPGTQPSFP